MALLLQINVDDKGNPAIAQLGKSAKQVHKDLVPVSNIMMGIFASQAVMRGISLMTQGFRIMGEEVVKFDLASKKLQAIGGLDSSGLTQASKAMRDLAMQTGVAASELQGGLLEVVKMGFPTDSAIKAMPELVDLATAATTDLDWASKNTIATLKAFNLGNDEVARVANVVATALNLSALDLENYMEAMKYIGPVSQSMNVSLEETSAAVGVLTNAGISGTLAGTTLKNMMLNLLKPSDAVANALQKMNLKGKTFTEILRGLKDQGLSVLDFLETFDKRAITGAEYLAAPEARKAMDSLNVALVEQQMKISDMSKTIRESLKISWDKLVITINEVGLSINDALGSDAGNFIDAITQRVKELDKWVDSNKETIRDTAKAISETATLLTSVMIPTMRIFATHLKEVALIWASLWGAKKLGELYNYTKGVEGLKGALTAAGKAGSVSFSGMLGPISIAISAGLTLKSIFEDIANTKMSKLDDQLSSYTNRGNDSVRIEELKAIESARAQSLKDRSVYLKTNKVSDFDVAQKAATKLENLENSYRNKYGETASKIIKSNEGLSNEIHNLAVIIATPAKGQMMDAHVKAWKARNTKSFGDNLTQPVDDTKKTNREKQESFESEAMKNDPRLALENYLYSQRMKNADEWMDILDEQSQYETDIATQILEIDRQLVDARLELTSYEKEERINSTYDMINSTISINESFMDIRSAMIQRDLDETLNSLELQKEAIQKKYESELSMAGSNEYQKQIIMQKARKEEEKIEAKKKAATLEAAQRERRLTIARASADSISAVIGVIAQGGGGFFSRLAQGVAIAAIVASYVAQLTSLPEPKRTGGVVRGNGNATSDSVNVRASVGERYLTQDDISTLGGNSNIDTMLDRGKSYAGGRSVNLYVENFIGTRQFVRDMKVQLEKEMSR